MKTRNKLWMRMVFVPLLFICLAAASQWSQQSIILASTTANGTVTFVKADASSLTFEVSLRQIPEKGCRFKITDQSGDVIFEKQILSTEYRKMYKIDRGNLSTLSFEATGKNYRFEEAFALSIKVEEKIEVKNL